MSGHVLLDKFKSSVIKSDTQICHLCHLFDLSSILTISVFTEYKIFKITFIRQWRNRQGHQKGVADLKNQLHEENAINRYETNVKF